MPRIIRRPPFPIRGPSPTYQPIRRHAPGRANYRYRKLLLGELDFHAFGATDAGAVQALVVGDGAVTFARSSDATVADWERRIVYPIDNEIRFENARRVENLLDRIDGCVSEDMTSSKFSEQGSAVIDDATHVTFSGAANDGVDLRDTVYASGGKDLVARITASGTGTYRLRARNNSGTFSSSQVNITLSATPQTFSVSHAMDAASVGWRLVLDDQIGQAQQIYISEWQLEDVTGQANQNPSEYVSVGVATGSELLSDANAVSLTNETDATTGWTESGLDVFESQSAVVDSGNFAFHGNCNTTPSSAGRYYRQVDGLLADNKTYVVRVSARHVGAGGIWRIGIGDGPGNTSILEIINLSSTDTTFQEYTGVFTAPSGDIYITVKEQNASNDGGAYVDFVEIKEADHGAFVDGVKYFAYENGNEVSSNVVTEAKGADLTTDWRALFEPTVQNELERSQEFEYAAIWVPSGDTVVNPDDTTAPDGRTTADQLIDDDGGEGSVAVYIEQTLTVALGEITFSVFAKEDGLQWIGLNIAGFEAGANGTTSFDLNAGTVSSEHANHTASIEEYIDGWYRCIITFTLTTATEGEFALLVMSAAEDPLVPADGTSSVFIWGAQVEELGVVTTYFPTAAAAASRAADVASPMFDYSNWSQTEGTWYVDAWFSEFVSETMGIFSIRTNAASVLYKAGTAQIRSFDGTSTNAVDIASATANNRYRCVTDFGTGSTIESGYRDIDGAGSFSWDATPASYDGAYVTDDVINIAYGITKPIRLRDLYGYTTRKGKSWVEDNK